MKTLVIYASVYGHTKEYAEWIAQALNADLKTVDDASGVNPQAYDIIMFGGPIYVGKVKGIKWLSDHAASLQGKRVILFTTGMTPPGNTQAYAEIMKSQLPGNVVLTGVYHLPGAIDSGKLKLSHRMMYKMVRKMASSGNAQEGMDFPLGEGDGIVGSIDQSAIDPIIKAAQ